ncbi:regulator of G protein signaling superfamily [Piedraia hortae CBS 480.64]|uniref:Regulator of G protein signaling superfamily n=1 Tax=Piedraia hortae CBS 480.64 TaxID=1314780 RepID=A0A6A7BTQ4_9PEZI|nr:regulator of G protein signaling superfamily [Piedraia hortae CBS 480.64]
MASSDTTPPVHDTENRRSRLPNLAEVLSRRTVAPVDLFSFYIYMRDVQHSVDYLDFWLDASQHMSLCRHYVRDLRRSVMLETPDLEKSVVPKGSSEMLEKPPIETWPDPLPADAGEDQRLSAFLRNHSPDESSGTDQAAADPNNLSPAPSSQNNRLGSPRQAVTRADIRASAERILFTCLVPGAEREIVLPQAMLNSITHAIEQQGRDDPEVFEAAKDYVFQAMERDAFPGFLRAKALGNLVAPDMMLRLIIGLLSLFAGLWTAFTLIFRGWDRPTRCWLILPFAVGVYFLASHQYMTDPLMAFLGYSEYTLGRWHRIQEPFVKKLLKRRAFTCFAWILAFTALLCCIFILVPSTRL